MTGWIAVLAFGFGVALAAGGMYAWCERRARGRCDDAERRLADAARGAALADQRAQTLAQQLGDQQFQLEKVRSECASAQREAAALGAQLRSAEQNLAEQRRLLEDAQAKLRDAFASVSAEALAKNNEAFLHLARQKFATMSAEATGSLDERKAQIEGLLKPMQEVLSQYQSRLADIEKSRVESYSMLREQLGTLAEVQRTLNSQTTQLVSALRRPNTRGQWGEITLRRLVELAGMSNRCDFVEQGTIGGEDGRFRPDMVVQLPGDRQIVIDCKASLDAFLDAAAAADEDNRRVCLQRHCQQVRNRARELSAKAYWAQFKRSPEFVVMFLPGESFLYAAIEQDGSLIEDFLRNQVIIATPTTLMALLKAIEFGWRQEEITQNAEEIRKHGVELYDRILVFATHFQRVGKELDNAVTAYNASVSSLESRLLVTARRIGELGARNDKEVSEPSPVDSRPRQLAAVSSSGE